MYNFTHVNRKVKHCTQCMCNNYCNYNYYNMLYMYELQSTVYTHYCTCIHVHESISQGWASSVLCCLLLLGFG